MNFFQSVLLGIVQGLTEFLPVSSSAHLVIVPYLFSWDIPISQAFVFDVLVQVASLVGVFAFFWRDIVRIVSRMLEGILQRRPFQDTDARLGWLILLATIPAGLAGLLLKEPIERAFSNPIETALELLLTAALLVVAERVGKRIKSIESINWKDSLIIGLFQAIAIFPGISRSGSTITGGMIRDLERPAAARFAFLMSVPIMLAAGLLGTLDLIAIPNVASLLPVFIPGFIASAVVSYFAIGWLLKFLMRYPLYIFAAYCVVVSLITILVGLARG